METLQLLQKEYARVSGAQRLLVSNPEMIRDRDAETTCLQSRSTCWRADVEGCPLPLAEGAIDKSRPRGSLLFLHEAYPQRQLTHSPHQVLRSGWIAVPARRSTLQNITARMTCAVATGRSPEASTPVAIFEPQSAGAPRYEPNQALAEFDCTTSVGDDNKKYLLDPVNAAIYFRASVLNQRGMGDALFLKEDREGS